MAMKGSPYWVLMGVYPFSSTPVWILHHKRNERGERKEKTGGRLRRKRVWEGVEKPTVRNSIEKPPSRIWHWEREIMKDRESRISYVPQPLALWLPVFKMPVDHSHFWCSSYSLESHLLRAESIVQTWNRAAPPLPRTSLPTHNVPSSASCLQNSWRWGKVEKSQPTGRVTQTWVEVAIQRDNVWGILSSNPFCFSLLKKSLSPC